MMSDLDTNSGNSQGRAKGTIASLPIWRRAFVRTWRVKWRFLFIYIITSFLALAVVTPIFAGLKAVGFWLLGDQAITNNDITYTILSPIGLITGVSLIAISSALSAFTLVTMMLTEAAERQQRSLEIKQLAQYFVQKIRTLVAYELRFLGRIILILLPFLAIGGLYYYFALQQFDINYYLANKPPEFKVGIVLAAVLFLVAGLILAKKLISWSLALPLIVYGHVEAKQAFIASASLTKNHTKTLVVVFFLTFFISVGLSVVNFTWFEISSEQLIRSFEDRASGHIYWLLLTLIVYFLINFLVGVWTTGMWASSLNELLKRIQKHHPEHDSVSFTVIKEITTSDQSSRLVKLLTSKVLLFFGAVFLAVSSILGLITGFSFTDDVTVISHRGGAADRPENTMAAFTHAMDNHSDWVELDVQEDADGRVIVIHDSDFKRVGNTDVAVYQATEQQISEIDIGSHFAAEYAAQRAPTLLEVLQAAKGKTKVLIELKYYGHNINLEQKVVDAVEAAEMQDDIVVMSLEYDGVLAMKELKPDWQVGLLATVALGDIFKLDLDFIAANSAMISHAFMLEAKAHNIPIWVWTLNDPEAIEHFINFGIDGVITDSPLQVQQVLAERESYSTLERIVLYVRTLID